MPSWDPKVDALNIFFNLREVVTLKTGSEGLDSYTRIFLYGAVDLFLYVWLCIFVQMYRKEVIWKIALVLRIILGVEETYFSSHRA